MINLVRVAVILAVAFLSIGATDCGRMEDARRLSSEQVMAVEKQNETRKAYYAAIDKLLDQQMTLAYMVIDDATQEQVEARNSKLLMELAAAGDDAARKADALSQATADISRFVADSAVKKQQIADRVKLIKAKHAEIENADDDLLAAQKEIDRWIQLKKVDEVIATDTINRLRGSQTKGTDATKSATSTALDLLKLTGGAPQ